MPITVSWYEKHHIVISHFTGQITLDEIDNAIKEIIDLYAEVSTAFPDEAYYQTHLLINGHNAEKYAFNLIEFVGYLKEFQKSFKQDQRQIGYIIFINNPDGFGKIFGMFMSIAANLFDARFRNMTTMGEALAFLQERDDDFNAILD